MSTTTNTSNNSCTRFYAFARQALVEALKLTNVGTGDYVLIPSLICRDVIASIHTVGATPIFYEVDTKLRTFSFPSDVAVKAILFVNYFGFAQDLEIFERESLRTGAVLIEDNAHGYLSFDDEGNMLGSRAPLSITSMRKTLRISDGAELRINDVKQFPVAPLQLPIVQRSLGFRFRAQQILLTIENLLHLPLLRFSQAAVRLIRRIVTGSSLPTSSDNSENENIVSTGPRDSSMRKINALDTRCEIERRRNLYSKVETKLLSSGASSVFEILPENCTPYGFPFFGDESVARKVRQLTRSLGVEVIRWPELPTSVELNAPAHYTTLWLVNFL
jgi:hypothetical protein